MKYYNSEGKAICKQHTDGKQHSTASWCITLKPESTGYHTLRLGPRRWQTKRKRRLVMVGWEGRTRPEPIKLVLVTRPGPYPLVVSQVLVT